LYRFRRYHMLAAYGGTAVLTAVLLLQKQIPGFVIYIFHVKIYKCYKDVNQQNKTTGKVMLTGSLPNIFQATLLTTARLSP